MELEAAIAMYRARKLEEEARQILEREEGVRRMQERRAQFDREFPEATKIRNLLLQDLRIHGIVGMIEQMIKPDEIHPIPMPPTNKKIFDGEDLDPDLKLELFVDKTKQDWTCVIAEPVQNEDGSLNPTLVFDIKSPERAIFPISTQSHVKVTYAPDTTLTIEGNEITFEDKIYNRRADKDAIVLGLAEAFVYPRITRTRYGQGLFSAMPIVNRQA